MAFLGVLLGIAVFAGIALWAWYELSSDSPKNNKHLSNSQATATLNVVQNSVDKIMQNFKIFYADYCYYPSRERLSSIISKSAMCSDENILVYLLNCIPVENPSPLVFSQRIYKKATELLSTCKNKDVRNILDSYVRHMLTGLTENFKNELIEIQKNQISDVPVFRFNYSMAAHQLVLICCSDAEDTIPFFLTNDYKEFKKDLISISAEKGFISEENESELNEDSYYSDDEQDEFI